MNALRRHAAERPSTGTAVAVLPAAAWDEAANSAAQPLSQAELAAWLDQQDFPGLQARAENGQTPLMRAAWHGEHAVVEALLARGAAPDAVNDDGNNALWFACLHGGPATILRLIQAGAPIDHANDDDITCLMQAAASGRLELVHMLLSQGAVSGLSAPDGRSAFDMAADRGLELLRLARSRLAPR